MKTPKKNTGLKKRAQHSAETIDLPKDIDTWNLCLYVAGQSSKSLRAFTNLKKLCEQHLAGRYRIEVVDLLKNPQLAVGDQILALPTLVRKLPSPMKKIIGDLSDQERTLVGMDLKRAVHATEDRS